MSLKRIPQVAFERTVLLREFLRSLPWRFLFGRTGRGLHIYGPIFVEHPQNVFFGDGCTLGAFSVLNARERIEIGNQVRISAGVKLMASGLNLEPDAAGRRQHFARPIRLEDGCWIGTNAVILPGVVVGKDSVVAAGAVVTRDVPAGRVVAGVPARALKSLSGAADPKEAES